VLSVALDGHDVNRFRLVRVNIDHEAEIGGKISADFLPGIPGVVTAHDIPMFLHEQDAWTSRVHGDMVNAMTDLGIRVGNVWGVQSTVDRLPRIATIVRTKRARRRDRDEHPLRILRIQNNRVQTQTASAGLPHRACAVSAESRNLLPCLSAIFGAEQCGVFYPGIHIVRIGERRFEVPDALELPGMLCAVVPLVSGEGLTSGGRSVIDEFVALARRRGIRLRHHLSARSFPSLAAVI
jgi:hypothetical protein